MLKSLTSVYTVYIFVYYLISIKYVNGCHSKNIPLSNNEYYSLFINIQQYLGLRFSAGYKANLHLKQFILFIKYTQFS